MRLKTVMKVIVCLSVALFFLVGPAQADKRYQIVIGTLAKAGSIELRPGEYTIILDNSKVRFAETKTGKEFEVSAKIDDSAKTKFADTEVYSKRVEEATLITEIRLGGTKTKLLFP
ncbi:MAG: hypothetical protein ABSB88_11020 [Bryobacteraceae bacterium]|jgi:hypothetical protein